jgi:4-hydroxyphenylpyruvate dioxygenase
MNEQTHEPGARLQGMGLLVENAAAAARRAHDIGAPAVFRRTSAGEQHLSAVAAPDGTEAYWADTAISEAWQSEFEGIQRATDRSATSDAGTPSDGASGSLTGHIDHINIATPWQHYDEAVLFNTSVLALEPEAYAEVPGPRGLVRSQVMRTSDGAVRLAMNLVPPTAPLPPRHVAVRVADALEVARRAHERGMRFLPIPGNYYDALYARFNLDPDLLNELRKLDVLYDRDQDGAFIHFYTPTIDGIFFEIVQRTGDYDGYGAPNAPIRLAAQPLH